MGHADMHSGASVVSSASGVGGRSSSLMLALRPSSAGGGGGRGGASLSRQSIEDAFFAVLFVMRSRGGSSSKGRRWREVISVLLDWLQMMAFVLDSSRFGWISVPWVTHTFDVLLAIVPRHFLETSGYPVYLVFFSVVIAAVLLSLLDALWVRHSFRVNQFNVLWPIKALKLVVSFFFNSLYLSSLGILLMALDCRYFDASGPTGGPRVLTKFPAVQCWGFPNAIVAVAAVFGALCVLVFAFSLALVDVDPDPSTPDGLSTATSTATLYGSACRALLVGLSIVFSSFPALLALSLLLVASYLAAAMVYYLPHYEQAMNELRAGLYAVCSWAAACAFILALAPGAPLGLSATLLLGPPAFLALAYAARRRFRRLCDPRLVVLDPSGSYVFLGRCRRPLEVEIATRFVRPLAARAAGEDTRTQAEDARALEEATEKADAVFQDGIRCFARSATVCIAYANFLHTYAGGSQVEGTYVDRARHLPLSFQLRFAVFRKDREREAGASSGGEASMDLVSFVEFRKKFRLAKEGHFKALKATRLFWGALLEDDATVPPRFYL